MPDGIDDQTPEVTPAPAAASGGAPVLTLTPDMVRNSPEYQAVQTQLREANRAKGRAEATAAEARTAAEEARQAAEAQRQQAIVDQLQSVLGEDGIAAFNEFAELSATDPVAAGRRFQEIIETRAQSLAAATPAAGAPAGDAGDTTVPAQSAGATPPPPDHGLSGDTPLGATTTGVEWEQIAKDADAEYAAVVERNQDPVLRARVTDRERAKGWMAWLVSSYIRGGARPKSSSR